MKKILFIAVLIYGVFANAQDTGFVYSGGIPTGTGLKVQDKTPVDDRFVRQDSASLHTTPYLYDGAFLVDIDTYSLWVYDEPNDTFIKLAKEGDLSEMTIQKVLNNGNLVNSSIFFPYNSANKGHKYSVYPSPYVQADMTKLGQFSVKVENDGYLSAFNTRIDRVGRVSTNTLFGYQALFALPTDSIDNTDAVVRGRNNTAFGYQPLRSMLSGYGNTAVGFAPLRYMLEGADVVAIGEAAATSATYVDESVIIGATAAANSSYLQDAIIIGRGAAQETDSIISSTLIGNFQHGVDLSENEIIIGDGRKTGGTGMAGVGFWVRKYGLTTLDRQTQEQYDLDESGKAAVTKEILSSSIANIGINDLKDTPANFTGAGGMFAAVNSGATGIEYRALSPTDLGLTSGSGPYVFGYNRTTSAWMQYQISGGAVANTVATRDSSGRLSFADPSGAGHGVTLGYANSTYQPKGTYLTANQTITLSGDLSGSGATSINTTIANDAVTNTKLANMAEGTIKGRKSGAGDPQDLSISDVKDMLDLSAEYVTLSGNQTIGGTKTFSNPVVVPDATLGTHAPNLDQVQEMIDVSSSVVVISLDPFTLPAMSSPPSQNSFSPIDLVTATLTAGFIDWEITWTDSGYTYKASAIGDFNLQIRESGGKVQIGGQTRSDSAYSVTSGMNPKLILTYPQNNQ